ncbi:hypothetical protein BGW37DRAFT_429647 [Umbelopsis sp. PMI_123]|nr:hypothetical protein BGW37DRAFT_429647 [Umbelopsis sp. PMI_123]
MVFKIFSNKPKSSVQADSASTHSTSSTSSSEDLSKQLKQSNITKALSKFLADPMRTTTQPDVVGRYVDPMGGAINGNLGSDPMTTGA